MRLFLFVLAFLTIVGLAATSNARPHYRDYRDDCERERLYSDYEKYKRFFTVYNGRRLECIQFTNLGNAVWCFDGRSPL